jgi:murein DD-endopeptidase MepM/ murein hydrolase activator NlpD
MVDAVKAFKRRHPADQERGVGPETFHYLSRYFDGWSTRLLRLAPDQRQCPEHPLNGRGTIIGVPYQGTHDHPSPADPLHNWESCNAVDLAVPVGTPCYAACEGRIGSQIGPLSTSNPVLLGLRLHLIRMDGRQEWYYAHLSKIIVRAGQHVQTGQLLGYTGEANGVAHLHLAQRIGDPGIAVGRPTPGYSDRHYPG